MRTLLIGAAWLAAGCIALAASGAYAENPKGKFDIWEDFEGGRVCPVTLTDEMAIGGFALEGDEACLGELKLGGDPAAWFIDGEGSFVLIDATRHALVRFKALEDGSFYADRSADGLDNLNLTPAT